MINMKYGIVMLLGFFLIGAFVAAQFILPQELQLPFVLLGAASNGIVVGILVKTARKAIIGGFLTAFLGTATFSVLGFILAYSTGLRNFGFTGLGIIFLAIFTFFFSLLVGLLTGAISAAVALVTRVIAQRRTKD